MLSTLRSASLRVFVSLLLTYAVVYLLLDTARDEERIGRAVCGPWRWQGALDTFIYAGPSAKLGTAEWGVVDSVSIGGSAAKSR
ncbi:MAG: hypothetical protein ACREA9_20005 [Pyrinomonadaceae bacterium]